MIHKNLPATYATASPPGRPAQKTLPKQSLSPFGEKPPRQPDWLLIMVGVLILITLIIIWLVSDPSL